MSLTNAPVVDVKNTAVTAAAPPIVVSVVPQTFTCTRFNIDTKTMPGFMNMVGKNLNTSMSARLKKQVTLKLGRPMTFGDHCVVATEDVGAKQNDHCMMIVDLKSMDDMKTDSIVSYCQPIEHIRDIHWIQPGTILAAADKYVQLYSVGDTFTVKCAMDGTSDPIHTDSIRELAVSPHSVANVASCGFDKTLCQLDLLAPKKRCVRRYELNDVIGSARWTDRSLVSVTEDSGSFSLFDVRDSRPSPVVSFDLKVGRDLFTHEWYTDSHMLFGYGDGQIRHVDLRGTSAARVLHTVRDPFVDCVGNIHYRKAADHRQNSFVVTGLTDFTVYRHNPISAQNSECTLWSRSHSSKSPLINHTGHTVGVSHWTDTTLVVADSAGHLRLFTQKFL